MRCVLVNTEITFTNSSNIPDVPVTWKWEINGTVEGTDKDLTHTFASEGTYIIELTASGSWGADVVLSEEIAVLPNNTPPVIVETTLPDMQEGVAYSAQLSIESGSGYAPHTWSAVDLPPGISIDNNGLISGTPTEGSCLTPMVTVTDHATRTGTRTYVINYTT